MRFLPGSKRFIFPATALLVATLVAAICILSFQNKVASFQPAGVSTVPVQGGYLVTEVASPESGLLTGDFLLTVNGQQPESVAHLQRLLRGHALSQLLVKRGEELAEVSFERPPFRIDYPYLLLTLIGLAYFLIGIYTAIKDREGRSRLFFLWCLSSATLYVASPLFTSDFSDRIIFLADLTARLLLPGLTAHLFLSFPERLLVGAKARLLPLLYLPGAVLLTFHLDAIFAGGRLFGPASAAELRLTDRLELALLVAAGLFAAATVIFRSRRTTTWEPRRQNGWILAGIITSYVPFLLFYLLPFSFGFAPSSLATLAGIVPLAALPLAFAWAIFKYRLLDLASILRNIAATTVTVVAGILAFQLIQLMIERGVSAEMSMARNVLTFAAGLLVAGVLAPTRKALTTGIERFQFRDHLGPRRLVANLGNELLHERSLDQLSDSLVDHLSEALLARVELYLAQGAAGLVPTRPRPELPQALPFDLFSEDFWDNAVEPISAQELPAEESSQGRMERRLFKAGLRYAFPVKVRGRRLGLLLLSYKLDEEPLSGEDLDLVQNLLGQAALAIENAQLLDEVQQRLTQVSRLEAYNKGILESSPAGLAVLDKDDRVLMANHAFAALCGRERQQCLRQPLSSLIPVRPLPEPADGLIEASYCEASGAERYLQLQAAIYHDGGEEQRVLIVQDRSEQVQLEQQLQEREHLASLGMLAAGVAHEVNTPLTGISSYAQFLIADTPEDDPRFAILKKMERQTFRASEIVNNLLDFARNRRNDASSRIRLDALCAESLSLLETRAEEAGVRLDFEAPAEPLLIRGNEGELHQVITNLVVNAIDAQASQNEERRVEIRLESAGRKVRLKVEDNGPGIPPERLATIFKPFFSSRIGRGGTGLGLAITYNIIRRHGGEIGVQNQSGHRRGCTFTVELPAYEQTAVH